MCVRAAVAAGMRIIYKFLFRSAFDIESIPGLLNLIPMYPMIISGFTIITALETQVDSTALCAQGDSDYSSDTEFGSVRLQRENHSIITQMMSFLS